MRLTVSAVLALLGASLGSTSAAQESTADAQELPEFVKELIARQEASPARSFVRIWRYQYKGETVYFVPQSQLMNDSTSSLYSSTGELICKPDGGYFGNGDGRCPDFLQTRSMGRLVWRDTRQAETIPLPARISPLRQAIPREPIGRPRNAPRASEASVSRLEIPLEVHELRAAAAMRPC